MIRHIATALALGAASAATAQSADHYRGGWRTDSGAPHVYQFVIRGAQVDGYYCTHCADGSTLARITGTFDEKTGLAFSIRRLNPDGSLAAQDQYRAKLDKGQLRITGAGPPQIAIKDPRGPTPGYQHQSILPPGAPPVPVLKAPAGAPPRTPPPYVQPAPWRQLSAKDVLGVWLGFGVGMEKQYFIIRQDGDRLFGLACGRCDNPYTHGMLDNFVIAGDVLSFDIVHQDWGDGHILPFDRKVRAHIAMNEMRMDARRPDEIDRPGIVASLVGPIAIEATKGNVVGD